MIEFADKTTLKSYWLTILPYYSKYKSYRTLLGILENHWSATLLDTTEITLEWQNHDLERISPGH